MIGISGHITRSVAGVLLILLAGAAPTTRPLKSVATSALPNAHVVTGKVISGAQPEGDEGFKELVAMGVKTIISVDGATPDVDRARKFGLRYVHLPIGYDGVTEEQGLEIAKAIQELPGPIYLHCHHGQHRSAAAVAVACVVNGTLPAAEAEIVLKTFGTGKNYKGLWSAAREARPIDPEKLSEVKVKYVEVAGIPELAETMVRVDERTDHLKLIQRAGWKAPADHPDLDPAHEALQLEELFREAGRLEASRAHPAEFQKMLADAEANVAALRGQLQAQPVDTAAANVMLRQVSNSCAACHTAYRD